ncbi:dipeptidyl-peptidase-4 [Kribbella aluminosa]|uniref:Dipeptidyl-peptidase-4 n=1 Tax=Kribbella aluminosa TaxID=416017 RepID=A0ABS4UWS2_9ACTN|nr:prolyl oligopeptidase family serine peptidase [Kribbella aluminosa]MBP2356076.1 dipeptidyl-peptidase-4 [Kribbella aluminosa]
MASDFLEDQIRTRNFSLGRPTQLKVSADGRRILFCRAANGFSDLVSLWSYDVENGTEQLLYEPDRSDSPLAAEERVRRERQRDRSRGVSRFSTDTSGTLIVTAVEGRLIVVDAASGSVREMPTAGPVIAPSLNRAGTAVAYVSGGCLFVLELSDLHSKALLQSPEPEVSYGLPEHVAAESFDRQEGFWWSPDGQSILVARVDNSRLPVVHLADPTDPVAEPRSLRYPTAGGPNADVSLSIVGLDGRATEVVWDRLGYEYLLRVLWDAHGLLIMVQNRAQTKIVLLAVDPATGVTREIYAREEATPIPVRTGVPARLASGQVLWIGGGGDAVSLLVDGEVVTPRELQVRAVIDVEGDSVLFRATDEPTQTHVYRWTPDDGVIRESTDAGVHDAVRGGGTIALSSQSLDLDGVQVVVRSQGRPDGGIASRSHPSPTPRVDIFRAGQRDVRTAVVLPRDEKLASGPLPVLFAPYGGPGGQRVTQARGGYQLPQWFADQGFAVVIADGRGTPARGRAWEQAIWLDKAGPVLEDQVAIIDDVAARYPQLDFGRVGIHGWSFGGYLAALAVLRRPDVFHAAVAGASVTDQRLYDTHWAERYLGHPDEQAAAYDRCSLMLEAHQLRRPLLMVHGLADDNVLPVHTFRLSEALTAAGRPHGVVPLRGVSHMISDPEVAIALRRMEVEFFHQHLGTSTRV